MVFKFTLLIILLHLRNVTLETRTETLEGKLKPYEARNEILEKEIVSIVKNTSKSPTDCKDAKNKGSGTSGIYRIRPEMAKEDFSVWCDMTTRGGGWTYVLNRFNGSQDFYKNWTDYKQGFGPLSGEHWLGLEHLYHLTNSKRNELLVELVDWESTQVYATYDNFKIEKESNGYKLASFGTYKGDAGDSFSYHKGSEFSTVDRGQRMFKVNCAETHKSGWWFTFCYYCLLTGLYVKDFQPGPAMQWLDFQRFSPSLKEARMMIRPTDV